MERCQQGWRKRAPRTTRETARGNKYERKPCPWNRRGFRELIKRVNVDPKARVRDEGRGTHVRGSPAVEGGRRKPGKDKSHTAKGSKGGRLKVAEAGVQSRWTVFKLWEDWRMEREGR